VLDTLFNNADKVLTTFNVTASFLQSLVYSEVMLDGDRHTAVYETSIIPMCYAMHASN